MQNININKIVRFKKSKINWKIISIKEKICSFSNSTYNEITVVNTDKSNDGRNYKTFREKDFLDKLATI